MRMTHNYLKQQFGGGYSAPDLEIYSVPVDRGFGDSVNFGEEGGTGNIIYGEGNDIDI